MDFQRPAEFETARAQPRQKVLEKRLSLIHRLGTGFEGDPADFWEHRLGSCEHVHLEALGINLQKNRLDRSHPLPFGSEIGNAHALIADLLNFGIDAQVVLMEREKGARLVLGSDAEGGFPGSPTQRQGVNPDARIFPDFVNKPFPCGRPGLETMNVRRGKSRKSPNGKLPFIRSNIQNCGRCNSRLSEADTHPVFAPMKIAVPQFEGEPTGQKSDLTQIGNFFH